MRHMLRPSPLESRGYLGAPDSIDIKRGTQTPLAKGPLKNPQPPTFKNTGLYKIKNTTLFLTHLTHKIY